MRRQIARGTRRIMKASTASLRGIHKVTLRGFLVSSVGICAVMASATTSGVTDIGAGFMPSVMEPMTKPGRAVISARSLLLSKVSLRSEEHTSELQSRGHLVCRLLLEKKKKPNELYRL